MFKQQVLPGIDRPGPRILVPEALEPAFAAR